MILYVDEAITAGGSSPTSTGEEQKAGGVLVVLFVRWLVTVFDGIATQEAGGISIFYTELYCAEAVLHLKSFINTYRKVICIQFYSTQHMVFVLPFWY